MASAGQPPHGLLLELFDHWEPAPFEAVDDVELGVNGESLEEMRFLQTNGEAQTLDGSELKEFQFTVEQFEQLLLPLGMFLTNFNTQLAELSKELERLKDQALSLSTNLDKKRELEQKYTPIVGDLVVPPEVVREIYSGEVCASWCELLMVLDDKRLIYGKYSKEVDINALKQLNSLLDALNARALERIKQFIVSRIKRLRVIGTPSQVVQNELLSVKEAFLFLQKQQPSLALELKQAYVYTMRWYYRAHFHRYVTSLDKLKLQIYDKSTLIGGVHSYFSSQQIDYTIGKRAQVVTAEDPTVMLAQIAEYNPVVSHMEVGFRSFNLALCDNASVEYLFMVEFFGENANALLEQIFDPTYKLGSAYTKSLISSYDIFGVLILIRLAQSLIFELQKRRIPVVEDYLNLQMILLWPKFQQLVDMNCENMKRSATRSSAIAAVNTKQPHPLTVQLTNLLYGFYQLTHKDTQTTQEPLYQSIQRLQNDYESTMTRMSKSSKKGELFLYVNYSHVLSVLGECDGFDRDHFKTLVSAFEPN
jgi:hypothetical protein